jgi:hypothetical protein
MWHRLPLSDEEAPMTSRTRALAFLVALLAAPNGSWSEVQASSPIAGHALDDGGFDCTFEIKIYDSVEISSLSFGLYFGSCTSTIPDLAMTRIRSPDSGWEVENFPAGFSGPATIATCVGEFAHFDCPPLLDELPTPTFAAEGPQGPLTELPAVCVSRVECGPSRCYDKGPFIADVCGDPDRSGDIQTTDALITLRAAVALATCTPAQCDTDRNGKVSVGDALRVLRAAVGLPSDLLCPAPCQFSLSE